MSEYQYYEWQTLERPLTAAEQAEVNDLSSHIDVTSSQAIVTYNWGDFKYEFLLKIVNGEAGAVMALRKKLLSFEKSTPKVESNPRTFGELLKTAEKLRQAESRRQAEEKRKKHIAEMQELAKREALTWQEIENLVQTGYTARNYDDATGLLGKLQQLSEFQGTQANFITRVRELGERYKKRIALIERLKKKGWI